MNISSVSISYNQLFMKDRLELVKKISDIRAEEIPTFLRAQHYIHKAVEVHEKN
jgi:hypothetical protein